MSKQRPAEGTATVKHLTVYHVTTNTDLTEGRGGTVTIGYFLDEGIAKRAAKGEGVMGGDARIEQQQVTTVRILDRVFLVGKEIHLSYDPPREVRARAIAKLTPEERRALRVE